MIHFVLCISLLFLSGCWDRKELNDRAIWLATGWDATEKGGVEISGQIVIPANLSTQSGSGGTTEEGFYAVSAKGKNVVDALNKIQAKLSREEYFGHRRVIFLGEEFAKRGLKNELDTYQRNPDISLRTDIFVVKGDKAKALLTVFSPLEKSPAVAVLKEHKQSGGRGDTAYLDFLMAATKKGIQPTIPVIEISHSIEEGSDGKEKSANKKIAQLAGVSVFDSNLNMLGYLSEEEDKHLLWVRGILKKMTLSISKKGRNASINLTKISCDIKPKFDPYNQVSFTVNLKGTGTLQENNSSLDMTQTKNINRLEKRFEKEVQKQVQKTIEKVQKEYGMDIFGFGEVIHRNHPVRWKSLKDQWDQAFPNTTITVKADIKINRIGMEGPGLLYKESGSKK